MDVKSIEIHKPYYEFHNCHFNNVETVKNESWENTVNITNLPHDNMPITGAALGFQSDGSKIFFHHWIGEIAPNPTIPITNNGFEKCKKQPPGVLGIKNLLIFWFV